MLKRVIGIFMAVAMVMGIWVMPISAADIVGENFEKVNAISEIFGSGKLITTATKGTDKLQIETETNGTYTNKYLSVSGANQQIVTGITLKEGKNVISMRVKFSAGCNELIALRGGGSSNTYVLSGMGSTIRLLHDSSKTVALNTGSWYNVCMVIDTTNKTIEEFLAKEGSAELTTHSKTYSSDQNVSAGSDVRIDMQGTDKICIDDIKVSTVNDKRYIVSESFDQFSAGDQGVAANKAISARTGIMSTVANTVATETANENTYLKLKGGAGILYGLNLFSGKQIWEMDIKLAPETHAARLFLHKSGGATANLMYYTKNTNAVKVFSNTYTGSLVNELKAGFVKFTFVIDKGSSETIKVYANGEHLGALDSSTVYDNIRFELNTNITDFGTGGAADSQMYIDNLNCYRPGEGTFSAVVPNVTNGVDVREETKITVTSNNMIDPAAFAAMSLSEGGDVTAVMKNGGYEYDLLLSGMKPETEYNFTGGVISDIYGQELGTVADMSFSTIKIDRDKTVYVSPSGSDTNDGSEAQPLKTIQKAFSLYDTAKVIVLSDLTENISNIDDYTGEITLEGKEKSVKLSVASDTVLKGDLTIDNITLYSGGLYPGIYACGHKLVIGRGVSTEVAQNRFSVYGGKMAADMTGDTNITVLGGQYSAIFGGGNKGAVTGNTNVVIGGTVNAADSVNDSDSNYYTSYAFGGGNAGDVSGKTNITLTDSAKITYVFGSNKDGGTTSDTNVTVNGGRAMNIFGGAVGTNITANTKVIMNGGIVEGIFGGSNSADITGSAYIEVNGGEVTRRIYSGGYKGTAGVSGGTMLVIAPEAKLCTGSGLSLINKTDMGIYGGSRGITADEKNTVICNGGSGDKLSLDNKGWDYIVKAAAGGSVSASETENTITITRDEGMLAKVNGTIYLENDKTLAQGLTSITFVSSDKVITDEEITIEKTLVSEDSYKLKASINMYVPTAVGEQDTVLILALYKGNQLWSVQYINQKVEDMRQLEAELDTTGEEGITVQAMLWDGNMNPFVAKKYSEFSAL